MKALVPLVLSLLALACADGSAQSTARPSLCREQRFEGSGFIVCTPASTDKLKLIAAGPGEPARRAFRDLGLAEARVAFAMNAGMYDEAGRPIGLNIVEGRRVHRISLRAGGGNFGMKPNGVFLVRRDGRAEIVKSEDFKPARDIRFATQSGPMLVIAGKLHPGFKPNGDSLYIRNGVGMAPGGKPLFVISTDPVSFGRMARFFRDRLKTKDALYFDGSVSSLWDPANGRMDVVTDLGPIIVAHR
ncbi:MAG: phosphodiester glycosidase family protein [Sphingomicrobium sp.]